MGTWAGNRYILMGAPLGGLKRVDLRFFALIFYLDVSSQVAIPSPPFYSRIRNRDTKNTCLKFMSPFTTITLRNDHMACAAIEFTPFFRHKDTFHALFYSLTIHWNHPLLQNFGVTNRHPFN